MKCAYMDRECDECCAAYIKEPISSFFNCARLENEYTQSLWASYSMEDRDE
jgi:hypothetical protein